ncbi:MAG TPA: glucoamylase family protein [Opitutus sp.]|nr:glucoamylase family protein [Opitutus sp.]
MKSLHTALCLACLATSVMIGQTITPYDQHVIFDNSLTSDSYESTNTYVVAPSTLELGRDGKLPVDTRHFVSPPNGLRLKWRSAFGGDWRATIQITRRYARQFQFQGDSLTFWCFSDFEITAANSPRMYLLDRQNQGTPSVTLVQGDARIPAGKWVLVKLPFAAFHSPNYNGTDDPHYNIADTLSFSLLQGLDDDREHTLYLDDIQIRDALAEDTTPPPPPGVTARGYERHIEVSWQPSPAADLLSYRIYRSWDGKTFDPVGIQQGTRTRFEDFVGAPPRRAQYRVTAVDIAGNESAPSGTSAPATTREFSDDELLTMVQEGCFRYYWEAGHPKAGLAPEVLPGDPNLLAMGGNGFGVMALLVGAERGFAPRDQVAARVLKIVRFLASADRFHGAWPHFVNGDTGKVMPFFGKYDDGGDLVETAFMMQGLLAARQYFGRDNATEREIRSTITELWRGIEWDWYRKTPDSDLLYWHWSPDAGFHISHPLVGWNETMIVYLLAIASPTHRVPPELYYKGWAGTSPRQVSYRQGWSRTTIGDHYANGKSFYGIKLDVGEGSGAELFFLHFSFMGFDPRHLRDRFTNYFENNRAIALINHRYCVENPRHYVGYGPDCWGLSAGINSGGGRAQPRDDNGTINVMASLASMPYTPEESMAALRHFYRDLGPKIWGIYGFFDGFNETQNWFEEAYMALDQAPITVMIENYRTGLVWKNFMANPEIRPALDAIGFKADPGEPNEPR